MPFALRSRIGTIREGRGGPPELRHRAGLGRRLFYDWTDPNAQDLSGQPVALLPGCAVSPSSTAAIRGEWWMGQDQ